MLKKLSAVVSMLMVATGLVVSGSAPANAAPACNPTISTVTISGESYQLASFPVGTCVWEVPAGVEQVDVFAVGGGGGGGGGAAYGAGAYGGAGGGGGQVTESLAVGVTPGEESSIVVGAGGASGAPGLANGPGQSGVSGEPSSITVASGQVLAVGGTGGGGGSGAPGDGGDSGANLGGAGSGVQAGQGGSSNAAGTASKASNPGVSSSFTGTSAVYGSGGGGASATEWPDDRFTAGSTLNGGGSYGGRGGQNIYTYGYTSGVPGGDGVLFVRWVSVPADAPTGVTANFVGDDVVIDWTAPSFEGSGAITGYRVEVNDGNGWNALTSPVTNNTNTTYTAPGLSKSGNYQFRVYAYASGTGKYSVASALSATLALPPEPYSGPLLDPVNRQVSAGERLKISGSNLAGVTSAQIEGLDCRLALSSSGEIEIVVPASLTAGTYDLVITSDSGKLTVQDAIQIVGGAVSTSPDSVRPSSKRAEDSKSVKVRVFDVIGAGKVQIFVNGSEIAWINAEDASDPKLFEDYLVRTIELVDGKNAIEVFIDGERVQRWAYWR